MTPSRQAPRKARRKAARNGASAPAPEAPPVAPAPAVAVAHVDAIDVDGEKLSGVLIVPTDGENYGDWGCRIVGVGDVHPSSFLGLTRLGHVLADALNTPGRQ